MAIVDDAPKGSRGPAYPYVALPKALEKIEQIHAVGMTKVEVPPLSYYKAWGYKQENGNARQILAALNHFGLVEYIGRGKDRKVKLSRLAQRILLDKIPNSPERAAAMKEAALTPKAYSSLWERFDGQDIPDHVLETYLTLERDFSEDAASKVIEGYRLTIECAGLDSESNLPHDSPSEMPEEQPLTGGAQSSDGVPPASPAPSAGDPQQEVIMQTVQPMTGGASPPLTVPFKVIQEGDMLHIQAHNLSAKQLGGLIKKLEKYKEILQMNNEENEDDEK